MRRIVFFSKVAVNTDRQRCGIIYKNFRLERENRFIIFFFFLIDNTAPIHLSNARMAYFILGFIYRMLAAAGYCLYQKYIRTSIIANVGNFVCIVNVVRTARYRSDALVFPFTFFFPPTLHSGNLETPRNALTLFRDRKSQPVSDVSSNTNYTACT